MFTDESFLVALGSLTHLRQFVYIFPCDPVQPAWRDLFRYCSSCELYHRRVTTKTYLRELLMPELPHQIQDFTFEMDEPKFQHVRVDTIENQHGIDRTENTRFTLSLWKPEANPSKNPSSATEDWCGFELSPGELRSWWPDNLTRLDLSKSLASQLYFDVPPKLEELVLSYPLEPNEIVVNGVTDVLEEDKQWFPESLVVLEVQGVPYHAPCEMQDNPTAKATSWMAYANKMLTMVPQQLEHFTISSYQVLDEESMAVMQRRVQNSLKTWKVRLLCPQRPKQSGFSPLQLYAPINLQGDSSDSEDMEYSLSSDYYDYDDSDGDMDLESISSAEYDMEPVNPRPEHTANYSANLNNGQAVLRQYAEYLMAEQYDVTPVMLRKATKGMKVLEKLDVEVNYQHYRFCSAFWKGNLGLSEPAASSTVTGSEGTGEMETTGEEWSGGERMHDSEGESEEEGESDEEHKPFSLGMDRKGKGKAAECTGSSRKGWTDVKGKGKKVEEPEGKEEEEGVEEKPGREKATEVDLMGHQARTVRLKTEIGYWNNSCCGKSCMGWIRTQQN
ncbi:MAG: hypothetical protein J3Q66DRAFT_137658 [Benniella sp.]|nr:MAG: hypothetical protein J3Q66DRAFT_137658 [Benniella sp.]